MGSNASGFERHIRSLWQILPLFCFQRMYKTLSRGDAHSQARLSSGVSILELLCHLQAGHPPGQSFKFSVLAPHSPHQSSPVQMFPR